MSEVQIEMPRYACNKTVWGLEIEMVEVIDSDCSGKLTFVDKRYKPKLVSGDYMTKHEPKPHGYYVVYKGGYESFSPGEVFEDGYQLINV